MTKWIIAAMLVATCLNAFGGDGRLIGVDEVYSRAERGERVEIAVGVQATGKQYQCYEAPATIKDGKVASKPSGSYVVYRDAKGVVVVESVVSTKATVEVDALDEVNAKRAARGLRPFVRDDSLTQGALACAAARARMRLFGHTNNDFSYLPSGARASAAGCAAYEPSYGWMSCCTYDSYTYAGAAYVYGSDGKRYMHLFVR